MRTKRQQYVNVAAIIAEATVVNQANDGVYAEAEKYSYEWIEASTATADGVNILQENRTAGAGRWHRNITASGIYSGTGNTTAIPNGNSVSVDITVTGASPSGFNTVSVINAVAINSLDLDIVAKELVAANTVRVTLYNNSGNDIAPQAVNVQVLQF